MGRGSSISNILNSINKNFSDENKCKRVGRNVVVVVVVVNLNLFILIGGYLLYNTVLVLPYINMNLPRVYTCSPS